MSEEKQLVINPYKHNIGDMSKEAIIKFQIVLHCYLKGILLTPSKLECLTLLGINENYSLPRFCKITVDKRIFTSPESTRNALYDMEESGLVLKTGNYRKVLCLHPDMKIQTKGNILVQINALYREDK